jgi:hypothetical protein
MNHVEGMKARVIESALKYARMKTMGRYIDSDGNWVYLSVRDQEGTTESFAECLLLDAVQLLAEMSIQVK